MAGDTLARMFWSRVEQSGDRPAQQFKQRRSLDHASRGARSERSVREVALGLIALGREKGDAVALLSASRAEWVQADFAIFSAGCITVPIYPSYPPDLIAYVVNDSGATNAHRRGSGPARQGAGGAGQHEGPRADRRHERATRRRNRPRWS